MRKKTYIIAEIGPNHNGSFQMAKKLVEKISKSGADAIKFQLADPDKVYSLDAFKANYQKKNDPYKSIKEMSSKYQLTRDQHLKISKLCKKKSLTYLCSAFDISSLKFLIKNIKIPIVKIPSGEIISLDILNYLSKSRKKIIISTGMSTLNDIKQSHGELLGGIQLTASYLAREEGIQENGYRTVFNCNRDAGQTVFHIHLHLLGGRRMSWPPG